MPNVGEQAPDFELPNQDGKTIKLSDYRGQKVIMFAFPKADTPGCTTQACGFRDRFPQIRTADAVVLGISADTPEELTAWKQKYQLPYDLLSDTEHKVLDAWGAWRERETRGGSIFMPVRSYWVVDENGQVIAGQVSISPEDSVQHALEAVTG